MNIHQKKNLLLSTLNSIIDHDDAPMAEVEDVIREIGVYIVDRVAKAKVRRAAAEKAKQPPL